MIQRLTKRPSIPAAVPAAPPRTILIIENGIIPETQTGLAWSDALEMIWSGERKAPLQVLELDLARGTAQDLTKDAVGDLAARAVEEGFTPGCLDRLFDDVWGYAPPKGRVLPCPIRVSPRFAVVSQ